MAFVYLTEFFNMHDRVKKDAGGYEKKPKPGTFEKQL